MSCSAARQLDLLGYGDSPAHRLDGRVKILLALIFVTCVTSFPKYEIAGLIPYFLAPVALGALGGVSARLVGRLLLFAAPFAALVGLFNPLLDRAPVALPGGGVVAAGWLSFASILLRFVLTVSLLLVLTATTSWPGLLHALEQLRVPRVFITQLHILHRYLFVLAEEADQLGHARALRDPARRHPRPRVAAHLLGALLWRTSERAERIYFAMKARGFQGAWPRRAATAFRWSDAIALAAGAGFCVALRLWPAATSFGRLILREAG